MHGGFKIGGGLGPSLIVVLLAIRKWDQHNNANLQLHDSQHVYTCNKLGPTLHVYCRLKQEIIQTGTSQTLLQ